MLACSEFLSFTNQEPKITITRKGEKFRTKCRHCPMLAQLCDRSPAGTVGSQHLSCSARFSKSCLSISTVQQANRKNAHANPPCHLLPQSTSGAALPVLQCKAARNTAVVVFTDLKAKLKRLDYVIVKDFRATSRLRAGVFEEVADARLFLLEDLSLLDLTSFCTSLHNLPSLYPP